MRRVEWLLIPAFGLLFWTAGSLAAEGVYAGDVAPPGTEVVAAIGDWMIPASALAMGALVEARTGWVMRLILWLAMAFGIDVITTVSVVGHALGGTCPSCDTQVIFLLPICFAIVGAVLVLGIPAGAGLRVGLAQISGGERRKAAGSG